MRPVSPNSAEHLRDQRCNCKVRPYSTRRWTEQVITTQVAIQVEKHIFDYTIHCKILVAEFSEAKVDQTVCCLFHQALVDCKPPTISSWQIWWSVRSNLRTDKTVSVLEHFAMVTMQVRSVLFLCICNEQQQGLPNSAATGKQGRTIHTEGIPRIPTLRRA